MTGCPASVSSSPTLASNKAHLRDPSAAMFPLIPHPHFSKLDYNTGSVSNSSLPGNFGDNNLQAKHGSDGSFIRTTQVAPRDIPRRQGPPTGLFTPPLTPEGSGVLSGETSETAKQTEAALDFVTHIFPHDGATALAFARRVLVTSPTMDATFDGVVLELPGRPKTLYVDGRNAANVRLRESIVALLELADESLQCSALIIALEKQSSSLRSVLHSLMYVGGNVVTTPPFRVNPSLVLVGMEI